MVSITVTYTSSRFQDRSLHIVALMLVSAAGNVVVVSTLNLGARFFAMFLMPMGAVSAYQIIVSWVANSFPRPLVKRSACVAVANMLGNCANIYGSYLYPARDGPRYVPGGSTTAAAAFTVALLALAIRAILARANRRLDERERFEAAQGSEAAAAAPDDPDHRAAGFRYIL